ncbi:MAG: DUF5906 domain-containing protein [Candidatus Babeliales bacterium]|nr:DUF5906 domain-containing protein [Candidatus Babeliales bacterium]
MVNITTKTAAKQGKPNRRILIKVEQDRWNQEAKQLKENKAKLGYKDFSREKFLAVDPNDCSDTTTQSQLIAIQEKYHELIERKAVLWAEDDVINRFNKDHAVVHVDQTYILTEKINTLGNKDFSLESRQSFRAFYEDEIIMCADGIERNVADIWLKSPSRRKYKNIVFDPTTTECLNGNYNLWKGFTRIPRQGDCSKYWDHVKDNICSGDQELYNHVRKWLAYIFQYPDQVHTALVLQASQGTGKNSFVEPLGRLLGAHFAPLSSIAELVSNFNFHLKNAVLIHANEALWGGNRKDLGALKAMITEQYCLIEGKGKDRIQVRNFKHVILSSNEDWPVFLDSDDRRFLVIRVSEQCKENYEYFKLIQDQLDNAGYEALLYDLLHEDLTDFNPRRMPASIDAFSIKLRSAESPHRYIHEVLCDGGFSIGVDLTSHSPVWQPIIPKDNVYKDYVAWCQNNREEILSNALFGRVINKIIVSILDTRPGTEFRARCYKLPSLRQAREEFCRSFKERPEHIFYNYEEI